MNDQFFGKPFRLILAILAVTFGLSILVFKTAFVGPALVLIVLAVFALTVKRLEWGLCAAFAELFANSHGHLIDAPLFGIPFSMRMAVFAGVMAGWFVFMLRKTASPPSEGGVKGWLSLSRDPRLSPFLPLAAAVVLGFVIGFSQHNAKAAFQDGNAYLYVLYVLPILSARWTDEARRLLLQTLAAGATWAATLTLGLLYLFTHLPKWMLSDVYTFIRDTRTGELTEMHGVFRIFLQAQMSVVALIILLSVAPFVVSLAKKAAWRWVAFMGLLWAVIVISLSRSFWVGLAAAGVLILALLVHAKATDAKRARAAIGWQILSAIGSIVILAAIVLFPLPQRTTSFGSLSDLFFERTTDTGDVAISSRWNLLPEMMKVIFVSPLAGSGFGQTVTFKTDDPRARAIYPDGTWTTYSFEWGWLDLWLKMGLLGPLAFLIIFGAVWNGLKPLFSTDRKWLGIGLMACVAMVYATHALSPYLNHPLGLGLILFTIPFWSMAKPREAEATEEIVVAKPSAVPVLAAEIE